MARDRFLIAPFRSGLVTDTTPWMIPEDAFEELNNAYIYKGVVSKRPGSRYLGYGAPTQFEQQLYSRLRINLGNTDGAGTIAGNVPGDRFEIGQMFSVGNNTYTVYQDGAMAASTLLTNGVYNTATGAYTINSNQPNTACFWYPADPVMGFAHFEDGPIGEHVTYAFDPQFSYVFNAGAWERSGLVEWNGTDSQFFWTTNWQGVTPDLNAMFTTNFNATIGVPGVDDDPIYSFDGVAWTAYSPRFLAAAGANPDRYVRSARIIIPFKDRLLLLNTVEDSEDGTENEAFVNRCRYSRNGSPFPAADGFLEGVGAGGYIDAPTSEEIISASFTKDRVIVYFERSTWEIVYVYNFTSPFVWQKINSEVGSKSQFSSVGFDRSVLTVGQTGIYACTGTSVRKIDGQLLDFSQGIRNENNGIERVHGIRDFFSDLVYWTFPSLNADGDSDVYPDKFLVFNYENRTWGTADDCITAFGNFEQQTVGTWEFGFRFWRVAIQFWDYALDQGQSRRVIAGNQQGYTFIVDSEVTTNAAVMQVTNAEFLLVPVGPILQVTIINHTLNTGDYIRLENMTGLILPGDGIYRVNVVDEDTIFIIFNNIGLGIYIGGGTAARVSRLSIKSKQWNFYNDQAVNVYVPKIDFCVNRTAAGEVAVDFLVSSSNLNISAEAFNNEVTLGNNVLQTYPYELYPLEETQARVWHPVYLQAEGENVQIRIYNTDAQMEDPDIQGSDFKLEGMVVHSQRTGSRFE